MTSRTRYFMIGSTLTVALVIGSGLVAFYNGELPMLRSHSGPVIIQHKNRDGHAWAV